MAKFVSTGSPRPIYHVHDNHGLIEFANGVCETEDEDVIAKLESLIDAGEPIVREDDVAPAPDPAPEPKPKAAPKDKGKE